MLLEKLITVGERRTDGSGADGGGRTDGGGAGRRRSERRGGALGVEKNDLGLKERSQKVSHFSLQKTHPESSSERVLTARRYPNFGRQRFESWGGVGAALISDGVGAC